MTMLLYIVTAIIAVILGCIIKLFVRFDGKFNKIAQKIPGPPGIPVFGNTFQFLATMYLQNWHLLIVSMFVLILELLPLFDKSVERYGHRIVYRVGTYWIVALSNPHDIEKLLTSTTETIKSVDYDQLIPWLGTGLLISNGQKWTKRRKLLTPAFHFKILERFLEVFNQQSFKFVEIVKCKYPAHEIFDVSNLVSKLTLDIICETAMGVKINAQDQEGESEYISAITRMKYLQQYRAFRPWLELPFIWNYFSYGREETRLIEIAHKFTNEIIQQRKLEYNVIKESCPDATGSEEDINTLYSGGKKRPAFLDLLLEAQRNGDLQSDEDVREETDTFMFEGHDTVSAGISFSLYLIGRNLDAQEKIHQELNEIFMGDTVRPITMQDLGKMKYLECCVKESLRIFPSVPLIARTIQNDFELEDGVVLPSDTLVLILPYQLHRNTNTYPDPLDFRPERFLLSQDSGRNPFAYIPFSAGPRNCIGQKFALMEEKIIIANVLRSFRITATQQMDELTLLSDLILHSENGIKIKYCLKT